VGESLTEGDALTDIVMLPVEDALLDGVILRVGDILVVADTLLLSDRVLEGVSLTERVTEGDTDTDSCMLLLAVVVLLIEDVGEGERDDVSEELKVLVPERLIEGVSVCVLEVEGGIPMVPAKL
jgi:hypothetical protein